MSEKVDKGAGISVNGSSKKVDSKHVNSTNFNFGSGLGKHKNSADIQLIDFGSTQLLDDTKKKLDSSFKKVRFKRNSTFASNKMNMNTISPHNNKNDYYE